MLTDAELDELQRDFTANGWTWSGKFAEVIAQAKMANQFRRAMRVIAAKGNPRDSKVAAEALEATNDGVKR